MTTDVDTSNRFMVAVQGGQLVTMRAVPQRLNKSEAMNLAAWLAVLADDEFADEGGQFQELLSAIRNL